MKRFRMRLSVLAAAAGVLASSGMVRSLGPDTNIPYSSYTYTFDKGVPQAVPSPAPYRTDTVMELAQMIPGLKMPADFCRDGDGNWYILDGGASRVYCLNREWKLTRTIRSFRREGADDFFNAPEGIFAAEDGFLYVADTRNNRVVKLSRTGEFQSCFGPPDGLPGSGEAYLPSKIAVSSAGMLYVIAKNDYSGILQLNQAGRFIGYMGGNKVTYDPIEKLWKQLLTKEQRKRMIQFIPVEYSAMSMDKSGFIYTVSQAKTETNPIKRLNPAGKDVLVRQGYDGNVAGDLDVRSLFVDICAGTFGTYLALDSAKGRIFAYDSDGNLLYAFGGLGSQQGTFVVPAAMETDGDCLYVMDQGTLSVTRFARTEYAALIEQGLSLYQEGKFRESARAWENVLKKNSNFEIAYVQIGKVLLRENQYKSAMEYFKLGNYRGNSVIQEDGYNKAYSEYRNRQLSRMFAPVMSVAAVLAVVLAVFLFWKHRKKKKRGGGAA